jgi:hypothetical protein
MFHLQEAARPFIFGRVAPDKRQRDFPHGRHFLSRFDERTLQVLVAKVNYGRQSGRPANPAAFPVNQMHIASFYSIYEIVNGLFFS